MARSSELPMSIQEAISLIDKIVVSVKGRHLTTLEIKIIEGTWYSETAQIIAKKCGRDDKYIGNKTGEVWELLSEALKKLEIPEKINKKNFKGVIQRRNKDINLQLEKVLFQENSLEKMLESAPVAMLKKNSLPQNSQETSQKNPKNLNPSLKLELPDSPVPLNSKFYIQRNNEQNIYTSINQPGALIRIKGMRKTGNTSLMSRITNYAVSQDCRIILINFHSVESEILTSIKSFLQWFCLYLGEELRIPDRLDEYWNDRYGSNVSCERYLTKYLLPKISQPLVLALDRIDCFFRADNDKIAKNFLALIRSWYDKQTTIPEWGKLKYIIVQGEQEIKMKDTQSPFNVGLEFKLSNFSTSQIIDLAKRHQLNWTGSEIQILNNTFGTNIGHPHLIRHILYRLVQDNLTLSKFMELDFNTIEPFKRYLKT